MNNNSLDKLDQAIKGLFSKYFQFDPKNPHVFYVRDITIHNPIGNLTLDIAQLSQQVVEATLDAIKQMEEQKRQAEELHRGNSEKSSEEEQAEIGKSKTSNPEDDQNEEHEFYSTYYDYYLDDQFS